MSDLDEVFLGSSNYLEKFTRDLTDAARRDELEPVRCREQETDRLIAILLRQSKNNPVLVGDAGVGKTAIVEGLACRIVAGQVPAAFRNARIHSLSHIDLIAGTSFRGQYEKRLQGVIDEALRNPDVLLFVDELHNLIGAGAAIGQPLDAANMLKPALSRGQLRVIGATTRFEYERFILPDAALERRFHPVEVMEMNRDQVLEVLQARRPRLEMHHTLVITDAALEAALTVSERIPEYTGRKHPDKAIDLLDEVCALYRLRETRAPSEEIDHLKTERLRLIGIERQAIEALFELANARGTMLERISIETYKTLEAMGLELERMLTGQTTDRPPAPRPESVRRLEESNPAARIADAHRDRILIEARLREDLTAEGFVVDALRVESAHSLKTNSISSGSPNTLDG